MRNQSAALLSLTLVAIATAFTVHPVSTCRRNLAMGRRLCQRMSLRMADSEDQSPTTNEGTVKPKEEEEEEEILGPLAANMEVSSSDPDMAATRTVNERLQSELEEAKQKEKFGPRSSVGKKMGLNSFMSSKTDEERQQAIEEARDLNGVNPVVALAGSAFALAAAAGLWALTNYVAEFFATHPVESDVYFVQRATSVFRNVVMGLFSLASGFFGVTGVGILFLGIRVAYGVTTGELDPTPIKKSKKEETELPDVWSLMQGQSGRRGRKKGDGNGPFGL